MKMNKYSILRWFIIVICALPLMSAGCESDPNDGGYGGSSSSGGSSSGGGSINGGSSNTKPSYADYVDIDIARCERVGSVLQIDFTVKNKKSNEITVELNNFDGIRVTDDNGTSYIPVLALGSEEYSIISRKAPIPGNSSIKAHAKVKSYDPNNEAKKITFQLPVDIVGVDLSNNQFKKNNITVVDNRIMAHGIQTNDLYLQWTLNRCYRGANGTLYVNFTVKNNTSSTLNNFWVFDGGDYDNIYDNLGNKYNRFGFRWGTENDYLFNGFSFQNKTNINAGGSAMGSFCIENFAAGASEISAIICVGVSDYIMNDDKVRFITIPIE